MFRKNKKFFTGVMMGVVITLLSVGLLFAGNSMDQKKKENAAVPNESAALEEGTKKAEGISPEGQQGQGGFHTLRTGSEDNTAKETASAKSGVTTKPIKKQKTKDTWKKTSIYVAGDKVIYQGKKYDAKWWTQGEIPGAAEWGPWNYLGEAKTEADVKSSNKTDKENGKETVKDNGGGAVSVKKDDFKVVVYYPSWAGGTFDTIQFDIVTHINYAFAIPKPDGTLRDLEQGNVARDLIKEAHKHGVKVLLAVGGWSYNDVPLESTFMEATSSDKKITKFGNAIVKMCEDYGFDGIDMDWEHPRVDGDSAERYEKLMKYLDKKLDKKGKLLTSAVLSGVTADGNVYYDSAAHSDEVIKAVDWFNVMAYDGGDGERHSSYQFAVNCGKYWKNTRKMPAKKVVLGMPFYARPSWAAYKDILAADAKAYAADNSNYNGMTAYYNGVKTIRKKTKYALDNLGGVMVWEITQDTTNQKRSLLSAIGAEIQEK